MTGQLDIDGNTVDQPRSWDGEPLYCADTVREGLFDPHAFEQMRGQTAMDWTDRGTQRFLNSTDAS